MEDDFPSLLVNPPSQQELQIRAYSDQKKNGRIFGLFLVGVVVLFYILYNVSDHIDFHLGEDNRTHNIKVYPDESDLADFGNVAKTHGAVIQNKKVLFGKGVTAVFKNKKNITCEAYFEIFENPEKLEKSISRTVQQYGIRKDGLKKFLESDIYIERSDSYILCKYNLSFFHANYMDNLECRLAVQELAKDMDCYEVTM